MDKWVEYAAKDLKIIWDSFCPNSSMKGVKCGTDTGESETTSPAKMGGWVWKGQGRKKKTKRWRPSKASQAAVLLGSEQDSSGNVAMWRWCYSFGSKLKIRDTGVSVATILLFLFLNWSIVVAMLSYLCLWDTAYQIYSMFLGAVQSIKGKLWP